MSFCSSGFSLRQRVGGGVGGVRLRRGRGRVLDGQVLLSGKSSGQRLPEEAQRRLQVVQHLTG